MSICPIPSLGWESKPHKVTSCCQWSWQAALLLAGSVLEAWGANVGLVKRVCGIKHFWRRWRGCQDGAEWFMGAQHRGEVLHFLCQLLDLPTQGSILSLQVFTLQVQCVCLLGLPQAALLGSNAILLPPLDFPHVIRRVLLAGWGRLAEAAGITAVRAVGHGCCFWLPGSLQLPLCSWCDYFLSCFSASPLPSSVTSDVTLGFLLLLVPEAPVLLPSSPALSLPLLSEPLHLPFRSQPPVVSQKLRDVS